MKPTRLLILFIIGVFFMVAILVSGFILVYEKTTEKQLMTYGQMTLDGSAFYVDSMMESTKNLLDNISLDADVSILLNYEDVSASNLLTGLRRLYKYESSSYFIDSIYIFNRRNSTVYVSSPYLPEAVYPISTFPDFDAAAILKDYSSLKNMVPLFRTYNTFFPSVDAIPYISFIRYNALVKGNESNVIMVNLRQDILSNLMTGDNKTSGGVLLLVDGEGSSMIIAGNREFPIQDLTSSIMDRLEKSEDNFTFKANGSKYIVCTTDVLGGNAKLLFVADERVIASITKTKGYGNSIILLGLAFIIILALCIFFLRRIWLYSIAQLEAIRKADEEKQTLLEASKRSRILSYLHSDTTIEDTDIFKDKPEQVLLIIIALDYYSSTIMERFENGSERNTLKTNILTSFLSFLDGQNILFSTYENDEKCIICLKPSVLQETIEKAKNTVEESFRISTTVIISKPLDLESIQDTYDYLCQCLSYRLLLGPGKTLTMPMLEEQEMTTYSIPDNSLKHLIEEILKLNIPEALTFLKAILSGISSGSYRSSQLCLVNLAVALDDAFNRLQINNGIDTPVSGLLIYRILKMESIQEIYATIETMMYQMEQAILQNKNNRQAELINDIITITREKYCEQDFSINTVADELEMNAAYLGRIFKKVTGSTFSEFVLTERMQEACRLLSSTDEPIDSIVSLTGFNDTPYFYKLFKRINGCTPFRFRQENKQNSL